MDYKGRGIFLCGNDVKIYQFKAKTSEIKTYSLCSGNISKDFTVDNMKKTEFNMRMIFLLIMILLTLVILQIFANILRKKWYTINVWIY